MNTTSQWGLTPVPGHIACNVSKAAVVEVIAFLASGRSRHTTGATIDITGAEYVR